MGMTQIFSIDAETYSPVDLRALGADAYSRHPDTRCLMLAFHPVGSPDKPALWLEGDPVPFALRGHIANGGLFAGWNVIGFDRLIYQRILVPQHNFPPIPDDNWRDSMHLAAHANLPRSLDGCGNAVGIPFRTELKDSNRIRRITDAKRTIVPATVSAVLNDPDDYDAKLIDDLQWLADRCVQDVELEEQVLLRLPPWPDIEPWVRMPAIDRKINDYGVLMDVPLVQGLAQAAAVEMARLDVDIARITDDAVPDTRKIEDLKNWLVANKVELPRTNEKSDEDDGDDDPEDEAEAYKAATGKSLWRLRKNDIADILARPDLPEKCRLALAMRAEAAKASARKLKTMLAVVGPDGRLRGSLILGGAQQTLRWSGWKWQPQNFPRDAFANPDEIASLHQRQKALATAIEAGRTGDVDLLRCLYEAPRKDAQGRVQLAGVLVWISRMLRRTLAAPQGKLLLNGDFAQVEARITAWLAQQMDMLGAYATGQDVYRIAASGVYGIAPEDIPKASPMRQIGKVTTLACGFGGGPHALLTMGYNYGIIMSQAEAVPIVKAWREANAATKAYWYATDDAAANAVSYPGHEFPVAPCGLVSYVMEDGCLKCRLPSGRFLRYWEPKLTQEYWDDGRPKDRLSLSGLAIKGKAVFRRSLYHTTLVENQVQAIAADLLATALVNMHDVGLPVAIHVHDSIAVEVDEDQAEQMHAVFKQAMLAMPDWAMVGLPTGIDAEVGARFG